jgi:16S rRNA (guanine(966)-N(2))-methyltransferase RsmD
MRVIAGRFKGRRLKAPSWEGLRPTSDRLRETLFNIVATRIDGARVLDGFAGTGALGVEALSRGASHVTFVEADRRAAALIQENLEVCGVRDGYTIERGDVDGVLRALPAGTMFDVVLLDPPYDTRDVAPVLEAAAPHVTPGGVIVLERATRREPAAPGSLTRTRDVRSGDSTLTFFECNLDADRTG